MDRPTKSREGPALCRPTGAAFLLAQLGAHGASRFGQRVSAIGLTPPDAGIMRKIASDPGISQQALAEHLSVMPSRIVALIDNLEKKRFVERVNSPDDRRMYALRLTSRGQQVMNEIAAIAMEHERDLLGGLDEAERATLAGLCRKIAAQQGLTPGVHPGYRQMGNKS